MSKIQNIQNEVHYDYLLLGIVFVSILIFVISVVAIYLSFKHVSSKNLASKIADEAAHSHNADRKAWREKIDNIVSKYHNKTITKEEAFAKLSAVAKEYISIMSGENIESHTLLEIGSLRNKWSNKNGVDKLRQTIAALYPPEFADKNFNTQAKNASVDQAAEWVLSLLEGWQTRGKRK